MEDIAVCGGVQELNPFEGSSGHWFLFAASIIAGLIYCIALIVSQARGASWKVWNSISFFVGVAICLITFWPPVMVAGHQSIVVHMLQHILVAMIAPIFIVQGKPLTLILKTLPVRYARFLTSILKSRLMKFISHPFPTLVLNTGGMMLLYLTPLYRLSMENPLLHIIVHVHLFFAGYLFVWSLIGTDAVPTRPAFAVRITAAFLSIALHAFTSKLMYAYLYPRNISSSVEEVREAAKLMYYCGDLAELFFVVILFYSWYTSEKTYDTLTAMKYLTSKGAPKMLRSG